MADLNVKILLQLIDKVSGPAKKVRDGLGGVAKQGKRATKSFQLAASLNQAAEGVARLAEQAKQLLVKPVVEFAEFEKSVAEVSTLIDESVISQEKLAKISEEAAATFGGKATDQAKALYQGISAGAQDAAQATAILDAANRLAIGGVTDTETAVDGLTSTLNAFGIGFERASEVSDSFFVAIRAGKTNAEELAASIGKVAPLASSMGLTVDQTTAAIAALTKQGINTKFAVSGLKAAFSNILKPSKDAEKAAKKLGIEFNVAALKSKGLSGFLDEIAIAAGVTRGDFEKLQKQSGGNVEEFERLLQSAGGNVEVLSKLFGSIEGINAVLALSANGGAEFTSILGQMESKAGATGEAFDKMDKTQAQALKRAEANLDDLTRTLGEGFAPAVNDALEDVLALTKTIKEFADAHPDVIKEVGSLLIKLVAFGAVLRTTLLLASTFSGVKGLLGMVGPLASVATGAKQGAGAMKALSGSIKLTAGGLAGTAGLIALAAAAGVAVGTLLDKALGLSDALAGVNQEIDKFKGGAPAFRGTLTTEERGRLTAAQQELSAAQQEREELKGGAAGIVLSEQGLDFFTDTDERIEAAKKTIDEINAAGRSRQAKFGATAFDIGEVERERGVTREEQAAVAAQERAADVAAGRAVIEVKVSDERVTTRVAEATDTDVSVDGGIRNLGT